MQFRDVRILKFFSPCQSANFDQRSAVSPRPQQERNIKYASTLYKPASSHLIRKVNHYTPRPIADYNLSVPVLLCYARLNTHLFSVLTFTWKNTLVTKQDPRQSASAKFRHGTRSASVRVRQKYCRSGSVD